MERAAPPPLASVRRAGVGSVNGPKIEAVRTALAVYAPQASVEAVEVASGVPEQPVGFAEIARGARNRAEAAWREGDFDLAIGIEDGLVMLPEIDDEPLNIGCAAVTDGQRVSMGLSSAFAYPPGCSARAVAEREPIGALFDALWSRARGESAARPSAQSLGNVGRLSLGFLTRSEYARHAVVCALLRFLHPDLYGASGVRP